MIIKDNSSQDKIEKIISSIYPGVIRKYWFFAKFILVVIFAVSFFGLGAIAHKKGYIGKVIMPAIESNIKIPLHYLQSFTVNPDRIFIDIKYKNFMKLAYKREQALKEGVLHSSSEDFVPARIRWKNRNVKINIRLKGDLSDHWEDDTKWSFRIKTKGGSTILGMSEFSLQDPRTRGFLTDWFLHRLLGFLDDFIVLRYQFVNLTINGNDYGIYLIEEHFDQKLVENNGYPNSPIIRIYDHLLWYNVDPVLGFDREHLNEHLTISPIDAFNSNKIKSNRDLTKNFLSAKNLLESFRRGLLKTHQVFDVKKLAELFAVLDLFGYHHSSAYSNIRFYYNPITSYLDPIGYDNTFIYEATSLEGESKRITKILPELNQYMDFTKSEMWYNTFFEDTVFFKEYIQALQKISEKRFLDKFLNDVHTDMEHQLKILYRTFPGYEFKYISTFYKNQEFIRNKINPLKALQVYYKGYNPDNRIISLEVGNIQALPVRILALNLLNNRLSKMHSQDIVESKNPFDFINFEKIQYQLPLNITWSDTLVDSLRLYYEILGTNNQKSETVYAWSFLDDNFPARDLFRNSPNYEDFDFLKINRQDSIIIFKDKNISIDRNLIIPSGFTVFCDQGTKINLLRGANILSYSSFEFIGSEDHPILITSEDSTGQGLILISAGRRSVFQHVIFNKLHNPIENNWALAGSVTFYKSPVSMDKCEFIKSYSDESLSIIKSDFEISHSIFRNLESTAVNSFSSQGKIFNSNFVNLKMNGILVTNSTCQMDKIIFTEVKKIAICATARSHIKAESIEIINSIQAIECKDLSKLEIDNLYLNDCNLGFFLHQERSEYGPAEISVTNFREQNVKEKYKLQGASHLEINGIVMKINDLN